MTVTQTNPEWLHDPVPFGYSHIADTGRGTVFIAGRYGSGPDGQVTSDSFETQADRLDTYVARHSEEPLHVVGAALARVWGDQPPARR
ncbi:hypothetical protein RB608_12705 [Nocardioides sp. LHD-245]|uniref:hypothetical protein n=1 Tax=Nocardioides sp. LHD-245 TaxID=3051387 RepID=UPI0027E05F24|nr:hypothetical protein [Nocardioides sp. LHD-245]